MEIKDRITILSGRIRMITQELYKIQYLAKLDQEQVIDEVLEKLVTKLEKKIK